MRINHNVKFAILTAGAVLALAACTSGSDDDASPSPSTAEVSAEALNVSGIIEDVRTATACDPWAGGKAAGEGVMAGWQYSCDADGDLVPEATLSVYLTEDSLASDLAEIEAASTDTGIVRGDHWVVATTDPAQFTALVDLGGEAVREMP